MWWAFGHAAWGVPWWPVFPVLWMAAAVLVFGLVRRRRGGRWLAAAGASAEHTLADRFARGEIDEDEYLERVAVLRESKR